MLGVERGFMSSSLGHRTRRFLTALGHTQEGFRPKSSRILEFTLNPKPKLLNPRP